MTMTESGKFRVCNLTAKFRAWAKRVCSMLKSTRAIPAVLDHLLDKQINNTFIRI